MKTKLLKKIRIEFSIDYYPHRNAYFLRTPLTDIESYCHDVVDWHTHKEYAIKELRRIVRVLYFKHTRIYKLQQVREKVWYSSKS